VVVVVCIRAGKLYLVACLEVRTRKNTFLQMLCMSCTINSYLCCVFNLKNGHKRTNVANGRLFFNRDRRKSQEARGNVRI
jgi:hypothetical protein